MNVDSRGSSAKHTGRRTLTASLFASEQESFMRVHRSSASLRLVACCLCVGLAVWACDGARQRSGFGSEKNPTDVGDGGPMFANQGVDAGKESCITTEAEAAPAPVDVILSVDQSGSMSDDLANVKSNINQLS